MRPAEKKIGNRGRGSICIIWEFVVRKGCQGEFERVYGPSGEWVKLFRRSKGFKSSQLLIKHEAARQYLTVDFGRVRNHTTPFSLSSPKNTRNWRLLQDFDIQGDALGNSPPGRLIPVLLGLVLMPK